MCAGGSQSCARPCLAFCMATPPHRPGWVSRARRARLGLVPTHALGSLAASQFCPTNHPNTGHSESPDCSDAHTPRVPSSTPLFFYYQAHPAPYNIRIAILYNIIRHECIITYITPLSQSCWAILSFLSFFGAPGHFYTPS